MSRARDFADLAGSADAGGLTGTNLLINGDFKVWQRATSSTAANYSGPDRWYYGNVGTYSRSTDVPSGQGFQYSNSVKVTAATTYGVTAQRIEAVNCKHLVGKSVTASFWLKTISGATGMYCNLFYANAEDNFSGGVTGIEQKSFTGVTGTWTYYTLTWNTLPANAANGLQLYFFSADGSTDPEYRITGVQLEVGEQATPFEHEPYGVTLQKAQRYYISVKNQAAYAPVGVGRAWSGTNGNVAYYLPCEMRSNPTVSVASLSKFDIVPAGGNPTAVQNDGGNLQSVKVGFVQSAGITNGAFYQFEFGNNTDGDLRFDAEL